MGKRGPKPIPTNILKLRGSWLTNNRKDEPTPECQIPDKPATLTGLASIEWDRITKLLFNLGVISLLDRAALIMYCESFAEWSTLGKIIAETGMFYVAKDGVRRLHPASRARSLAFAQLSKSMGELGLTPASRTKVKIITPKAGGGLKTRIVPRVANDQ